jgi:(p)ppGpp synthase/HD superfamily hydrolase
MPKVHYPLLHEAIAYALRLHKGQDRDGGHALPYITHPVDVTIRLRYVGGVVDEELLCAAALHDVVEETGATLEDVRRRFGTRVAELVRQVTRSEPSEAEREGLTKDQLWELRNATLLAEIAGGMGPEAWQIKLADRLSNLSEAVMTRARDRLDRYLGQTGRILEIIPRDTNPRLWDALREAASRAREAPGG